MKYICPRVGEKSDQLVRNHSLVKTSSDVTRIRQEMHISGCSQS